MGVRLVAAALAWAGLTTSFRSAAATPEADPDGALVEREQSLAEIERRMEALGAELIDRSAQREALIAELTERERDVAALAVANRELAVLVAEQTRVSQALRGREREERAMLARELARLKGLLRAAHAMGRADAVRMLLNQEDPVRASRVMSYFAYFNRGRVARIRSVEESAARLAQLARDAERETERLVALAERQETTRVRLAAAKREREAVLAQLEATIRSREADAETLERDAQALRRLVEHLRQRAQIRAELDIRRDPFPSREGRLSWPLLERQVLASFGAPRETAGLTWDGVLLATREGEEVRAIYDGRVVYADWLRGFGLLLVLDHGDGYLSFYGHNEAVLKEVGEWVAASEVVALSGVSGGRDRPVLYFAIRYNGEPVDPAAWCGHG